MTDPDYTVAAISEMENFYAGLFLRARSHLDVTSFGLAVVELEAGSDAHPDHSHPDQEEVYITLSGEGILEVEGEKVADLTPETMVRIGPDTKRRIVPTTAMRLVAIGGTPGKAYEAPGYSEVGAPDPAAG